MDLEKKVGQDDKMQALRVVRDIAEKGDLRSASELLNNKKAKDLFPNNRRIISVKRTDKVVTAFKALIDNGILSVPVYDVQAHNYVGFLDMLDITAYTLKHVLARDTEHKEATSLELHELYESKEHFAATTCETISDLSRRNPYYPIEGNAPLMAVLQLILFKHAHRVPIINENGELVTLITQSHLIRLIAQNLQRFGTLVGMKIGDLQLGYTNVISVHQNQKAIEAFQLMHEKSVSAVAVVDDEGRLMGNISASDLKVIGYDAKLLWQLFVPITEFMQKLPENPVITGPIAVTPESTFEETVTKLDMTRVHRVYVVDEGKAIGVISGHEIIQAILSLF